MFTPITFQSKKQKKILDRQTAVQPITSVAQTETGIWDITKAGFDISYNEERYGALTYQLGENGINRRQRNDILRTVYSLTNDEQYKPDMGHTLVSLISGEKSYQNPNEVFTKFFSNDELIKQYDDHNKESGGVSMRELKDKIIKEHEERATALQDVLSRNDSSFQKFIGNLQGGFGAALDPMLIPGIAIGIATGGGKWYAEAAIAMGITAIEEGGLIQPDVAQFKEFLGEDYNQWLAVVTTSGFAAAIPIFGKGLGKAIRLGKVKLTPAIKKLQKDIDEISDNIENVKVGDAYEANRASQLIEETGSVKGAKLPIHKNSDVVLKGIDSKFDAVLKLGNSKNIASTLLAKVGAKVTNTILEQAQTLGRQISDITPEIIQMIHAQKTLGDAIDLDAAVKNADVAKKAKQDADAKRPIPQEEKAHTEIDPEAEHIDYDLADEIWEVESGVSRASPSSPKKTNREVFNEITEQEERWKNFNTCVKGA